MSNTATFRSHKIIISFDSPEEALEWFDTARALGAVPDNTDLYRADALDLGGRTDPRTYLIRRFGDRPSWYRLRKATADTAADPAVTLREGDRVFVRHPQDLEGAHAYVVEPNHLQDGRDGPVRSVVVRFGPGGVTYDADPSIVWPDPSGVCPREYSCWMCRRRPNAGRVTEQGQSGH